MTLESLARQFYDKVIEVTAEEAMALDWVLTLHNFDQTALDWLLQPDVQNWREQAGQIIVKGEGNLYLTDTDLKILLTLVHITFRFAENDVGYSLKVKLYKAHLNIEDKKDANQDKADNQTDNQAESSSRTPPESLLA